MINIDTRSREPIYMQIEKQIVKLINLGIYEGNCALPSVRTMACDLGINPNTVARAYKSLEQQGIIYTIGGKGVFVNANNEDHLKAISLSQLERALKEAKGNCIEKNDALTLIDNVWKEQKND